MILLVGEADDATGIAAVLGVLLGVLLIVLVFFLMAGFMERALGRTLLRCVWWSILLQEPCY